MNSLAQLKKVGTKVPYRERKAIYIAGRVGDLTDDVYYLECKAKFGRRERELLKLGYRVYNPMTLVKRDTDWHTAMRICVRALTYCDYISPLPDASESPGARIELGLAETFNMKKIFPSKMNSRHEKK